MEAVLDTTVIVHLLRRYDPALSWLDAQRVYGITVTTWMEVMSGTTSKTNQTYAKGVLDQFEVLHLTTPDQTQAMTWLEQYQFSHHIAANDCLIAAVALRLKLPLYTHNLKDMTPLIDTLALKPY